MFVQNIQIDSNNINGTTLTAQAVSDQTRQEVVDAYLAEVLKMKQILERGSVLANDPLDLVTAMGSLRTLAQNGMVLTDPATNQPRTYYVTTFMAQCIDMLSRSLRTAGITTNASSDVNAVLRWQSLEGQGISEIVDDAVNAAAFNRSFQAMVELEYVQRGNEILDTQLNNLNTAITATKSVTEQLTSLQSILNLLTPEVRDTTDLDIFLNPEAFIESNKKLLFELLTEEERQTLGISDYTEITKDVYNNFGFDLAPSVPAPSDPALGIKGTILQSIFDPDFDATRLTAQQASNVNLAIEPDFTRDGDRQKIFYALNWLMDNYSYLIEDDYIPYGFVAGESFSEYINNAITTSYGQTLGHQLIHPETYGNLEWTNLWSGRQEFGTGDPIADFPAFGGLRNVIQDFELALIQLPIEERNITIAGVTQPILTFLGLDAYGLHSFGTKLDFNRVPDLSSATDRNILYDNLWTPAIWAKFGIYSGADITQDKFTNNIHLLPPQPTIKEILLKRYFDPQETNRPTLAQLHAIGLSPEPDFTLRGERERVLAIMTPEQKALAGIPVNATVDSVPNANDYGAWQASWLSTIRPSLTTAQKTALGLLDPQDPNLGAVAGFAGSSTFWGILELLTQEEIVQLGLSGLQERLYVTAAGDPAPDWLDSLSLMTDKMFRTVGGGDFADHTPLNLGIRGLLLRRFFAGGPDAPTVAELNNVGISLEPRFVYKSEMQRVFDVLTPGQRSQFGIPVPPATVDTFQVVASDGTIFTGTQAWNIIWLTLRPALSSTQKEQLGIFDLPIKDPVLTIADQEFLINAQNGGVELYHQITDRLFKRPIDPVIDYKGRQPQDVIKDISNIRTELAAQLAKLDQINPPDPITGRDPNSLAQKIADVLKDLQDTIGDKPDFSNLSQMAAAQAGLEKYIIDNQNKHADDPNPADQELAKLSGDYQRRLSQAMTAATNLNDTQNEDFRRFTLVFEEFYKSASAILTRLTQIIEKMAQNAGR